MLLVDGVPLGEDEPDLLASVLRSPGVVARSGAFARAPARPVPRSTKSLCVLQQEVCTVDSREEGGLVLGSVDATTCVIVCLVSGTRTTLAHLDSPQSKRPACLNRVLRDVDGGQAATLHLVGGYMDEGGLSLRILSRILRHFACSPVVLLVGTACVGHFNTIHDGRLGVARPVHTCMAVTVGEGGGVPYPAEFDTRGPSPHVRHACLWAGPSDHPLRELYDPHKHRMIIQPYEIMMDDQAVPHIQQLLAMDDEDFLEQVSTSPKVEPPNFVQDTRTALEWILRQRDVGDLFGGVPWEFQWAGGGGGGALGWGRVGELALSGGG